MNQPRICTSGFIMNQGKVLLVRRNEDEEFLPGFWELPGGQAEARETAEETMRREVKEEIGVDCTVGKRYHEFTYIAGSGALYLNVCFIVTIDSYDFTLTEHSAFAWVAPQELSRYTISAEMRECILRGIKEA